MIMQDKTPDIPFRVVEVTDTQVVSNKAQLVALTIWSGCFMALGYEVRKYVEYRQAKKNSQKGEA